MLLLCKYWVRLRQNNSLSWTDNKVSKMLRLRHNTMPNGLSSWDVELFFFLNFYMITGENFFLVHFSPKCFSSFIKHISKSMAADFNLWGWSSQTWTKIMKCVAESNGALTLVFEEHAAKTLFMHYTALLEPSQFL